LNTLNVFVIPLERINISFLLVEFSLAHSDFVMMVAPLDRSSSDDSDLQFFVTLVCAYDRLDFCDSIVVPDFSYSLDEAPCSVATYSSLNNAHSCMNLY
jgi:hypothetical protein